MNLLAIAKKRTVTKLKDDVFANGLEKKRIEYFDYKNRVVTSHLDSRESISSDIPGSRIVGAMEIPDILRDHRY